MPTSNPTAHELQPGQRIRLHFRIAGVARQGRAPIAAGTIVDVFDVAPGSLAGHATLRIVSPTNVVRTCQVHDSHRFELVG